MAVAHREADRVVVDLVRERRPQRDEVQQLLALLCERLERDGTPPRTVINLTAGQWQEVSKR